MDCWNFAEVMQYIAYGGFVFVNLSALIRWGIRRVKFLQRDVVGEDGKLYDFFSLIYSLSGIPSIFKCTPLGQGKQFLVFAKFIILL